MWAVRRTRIPSKREQDHAIRNAIDSQPILVAAGGKDAG